MKYYHSFMLGMLFIAMPMITSASTGNDSIKVEKLLRDAAVLPADSNRILFFAKQLTGIPYVAGTLDEGAEETLIVHLDKADCTTFVETVLALAMADKKGSGSFDSFKQALQQIRYRGGKPDGYASRLHYFSDWIKDNEQKGIVKERTGEMSSSTQVLQLDFMSTHPESYKQLKDNPVLTAQIARQEREWKNVSVFYFPKEQLNYPYYKMNIRNGDILAITTNIKGLNVVHTGFACWVGGKLHLLHASSVMKKVILDPQPLYDYSKNKKAHTGVRVISFLP
jgi:hypothetical protein